MFIKSFSKVPYPIYLHIRNFIYELLKVHHKVTSYKNDEVMYTKETSDGFTECLFYHQENIYPDCEYRFASKDNKTDVSYSITLFFDYERNECFYDFEFSGLKYDIANTLLSLASKEENSTYFHIYKDDETIDDYFAKLMAKLDLTNGSNYWIRCS